MKVIKKFNNNVVLCLDNNNCEVVAIGTGIGFQKLPYELEDLNKIERTFYGVNAKYIELINEIPEKVFMLTAATIDYATTLIEYELSSNLTFTLADHINFAITRHTNNIPVRLTLYNDIRHLYKSEVKIGEYALMLINRELNIRLFPDEALGIAMHIINSNSDQAKDSKKEVQLIDNITKMIENDFNLSINRNSMNYARFVSHMQYFIKKDNGSTPSNTINIEMFDSVKEKYPNTYTCAKRIITFINKHYGWNPNDEEILYIMLHINRLCAREECYQ